MVLKFQATKLHFFLQNEKKYLTLQKKILMVKTMNRLIISTLIAIVIFSSSCVSNSSGKLPIAVGNTGEVLFVMGDYLWRGASGDSIRKYFSEPVWGLPNFEPMFSLTQNTVLTKFMQKFRNMVIINVDPGLEHSNFRIRTNVYANNQVVFNLDAPSADSIISGIYKHKDLIIEYVLMKDREAIIEDYVKTLAKPVIERVNEKFNVDIVIPRSYSLDVDRDNFMWIAREEGERMWGILIWEEPYLRTSQLDTDSLIIRMNEKTKQHVPGPIDGSYMAVAPVIPPVVRRFEKNGVYSVQLNGMWHTENAFMAGPYVKQTIVDVNRGKLVTGLGFVFYPNREKRQMIRQLEAILYTMMPTEDNPSVAELR